MVSTRIERRPAVVSPFETIDAEAVRLSHGEGGPGFDARYDELVGPSNHTVAFPSGPTFYFFELELMLETRSDLSDVRRQGNVLARHLPNAVDQSCLVLECLISRIRAALGRV